MVSAFKVLGMDCAEEMAAIRAELAHLPGVEELAFDLLRGKLTVTHDAARFSETAIIAAVSRAGLRAEPWQDVPRTTVPATLAWRNPRTQALALSGLLIVVATVARIVVHGWGALFADAHEPPLATRILYVAAALAGAWFVLPKAWRALLRLRPDMNLLMVVAVCGAIVIGEEHEAALVAFLFALSLTLESWSVGRARNAIAALMSDTPSRARVIDREGHEEWLDAEQVPVGSTIVVPPGEKIPLDGRIERGSTSIDQASITGEAAAVPREPGDAVFAGTINLDGVIQIVTSRRAEDTTLARIIKLVGDAQSKRGPSEQWVERFARIYTPTVMAAACVVALLPPLVVGGAWSEWIYRGLVLLVIACPCALVISTPVSIVAALTAAARRGILIKGGPYLEAAAKIRALAFDKTGTLTTGRPSLHEIVPLAGHTPEEVLAIAAAIERHATHLLGQAVIAAAKARGIEPPPAADFRILPGKGATVTLNGGEAWVGSPRLLMERGQDTPELQRAIAARRGDGASLVVVGENHHVCGLLAFRDEPRPAALEVIHQLHGAGVRPVVMLTGDHRGAAEAIARQVAVDVVMAELLPEDKVRAIEQLVAQHGAVAMVGDGVNDAPALARATLGIAMGAAGSDAALETADVALMGDELDNIPWLIHHARRTLRVIRQNIVAALGVKAAFVVLNVLGEASLWSAIAADTGMSLLVVVNALRLLHTPEARPLHSVRNQHVERTLRSAGDETQS